MNRIIKKNLGQLRNAFILFSFSLFCGELQAQYATTVEVIDMPNATLNAKVNQNLSDLLTEFNKAQKAKKNLSLGKVALTADAKASLETLWEVCPFRCGETEVVERCLVTSRGYQVRNIPVVMEPLKGEKFDDDEYQELVLNINNQGEVSEVYFSININQYNKIMRSNLTVTDLRCRQMVLDFVENFRTAYNRKDLDLLSKVFSDDALIITGSVVKAVKGDNMVGLKPTIIYKSQTKQQYLTNLKNVFAKTQRLNIKFDEVKVVNHGSKKNYYGVTLKQAWNADSYSDLGYVFLIMDFKDEMNPQIHVRTWQPDDPKTPLSKSDIFSLSDFDIKE